MDWITKPAAGVDKFVRDSCLHAKNRRGEFSDI